MAEVRLIDATAATELFRPKSHLVVSFRICIQLVLLIQLLQPLGVPIVAAVIDATATVVIVAAAVAAA